MKSKTFGSQLKKALKVRKMTQKELGKLCGLSKSGISQYANDVNEPGMDSIIKIAKALNVRTDWLLGLSNIT